MANSETLELGVKSAKLASFVAAAQLATVVTGGIMLVVVARLLGPTQYGIYTLAYSVSALFGLFNAFGLAQYLNKYIPSLTFRKKRRELGETIGSALLLTLLAGAVVVVIVAPFSGLISAYVFHSSGYVNLILISLFSMIFTSMMSIEYNALIGFRDGVGSSLTYVSGNAAIAALSIALVYLGYGPLGAIAGLIGGSFVGVLVGLAAITRHSRLALDIRKFWSRVRQMVSFSLPLAGSNLVTGIMGNFSILFLGAFSTAAIIGSFGIAYRIGRIVWTVISFIGAVLIQMFATVLEGKNALRRMADLYNYSIYFGALVSVPIAVVLITLPHAFATSLFPSYKSSQFFTPTLVFGVLLGIISAYATSVAVSTSKVKAVLRYAVITAITELIVMALLVPSLNAYGVIIGMFYAGSLVSDFLYARYLKRELGIETALGKLYRILGANVVLGLLLLPINLLQVSETAQLLIAIVLVVIAYPILLGAIGAFGQREVRIVRAIGESMPLVGNLLNVFASYASVFTR